MEWSTVLASFVAAVIGGIVSPLVSAKIDDAKNTKQHRRERLKLWRDAIANIKDFNSSNILNMRLYSEIRPHLSNETKSMLEGGTMIIREGRGGNVIKTALLDDMATLEKNWKLLE